MFTRRNMDAFRRFQGFQPGCQHGPARARDAPHAQGVDLALAAFGGGKGAPATEIPARREGGERVKKAVGLPIAGLMFALSSAAT